VLWFNHFLKYSFQDWLRRVVGTGNNGKVMVVMIVVVMVMKVVVVMVA
jgi:hypothetical protein